MTPGYRGFIAPEHPLVEELGPPPAAGGSVLERFLGSLGQHCRYVSAPPGQRDFDQLLDELRSARGEGRPLELNCINMVCALVSCLRAAGLSSREAFAAIGTRQQSLKIDSLGQPHAWAVVRGEDGILWIDPATLEAQPQSGAHLLSAYHLFVLFNDEVLCFSEDEKKNLLREIEARPRMYLFGEMEPDLWALARSPEIMGLFRQLFHRERVAGETAAEVAYNQATARGLLRNGGDGFAPGPKVVLVPMQAEEQLLRLVEPLLDTYLGIVSETVPELRRAWAAGAAAEGFEWPEVAHAVIAGMFVDLAVGRRLEIAREVREDQGPNALWIFERVSAGNPFGVQWLRHPGQPYVFSQLWHRRVPRQPPAFSPRLIEQMARLARRDSAGSSPGEMLLLRHLKLVDTRPGAPPRFHVPVFGPRDVELLQPPLEKGAERIVREVIEPAFELAAGHPWWRRTADEAPYRHAVVRLLLDYITDRMVDSGLLPPFPAVGEDGPGWGRWLVLESEEASSPGSDPAIDAGGKARV